MEIVNRNLQQQNKNERKSKILKKEILTLQNGLGHPSRY